MFWDQDGILLIYYLPKDQTINAEYYSSLLVQLKDILKEKRREKITEVVLFLNFFTGPLQPRRNWHTSASSVLITSPDLSPSDYYLFLGLKKTIESSPFLVRRGVNCCRGHLVGWTNF